MINFICPFCEVVREDVPTGEHILKDGYLLECDYCYEIVTVRFEISAPNNASTRLKLLVGKIIKACITRFSG